MKYGHIVSAFYGRPWAILPETLEIMADLLSFRVQGGRLSAEEIHERIEASTYVEARRDRETARPSQGIGYLQLYGVIAPRASMLEETSTGGTGLDSFMGQFRAMMADPEVGSILIDIDSPGGQVGGVPEAAAEIRAARDRKPITAFANTGIGAASAAYYIGSQAGEFVASPSAEVGSIGVRMVHQDKSAMYEKLGIKHTIIDAGKYKSEGNPYGPLGEETIAYAKGQIETLYQGFLKDVSKGMRVPLAKVKSDFGEGRMLSAEDALKAGMIHRIDTLGGTVQRVAKAIPARTTAAALVGPGWVADLDLPEGTEVILNGTTSTGFDVPDLSQTAPVETADGFAFELELRRRRAATR